MNYGTSTPQISWNIEKEKATFYGPVRKILKDVLSDKKQNEKQHVEWATICVNSSVGG